MKLRLLGPLDVIDDGGRAVPLGGPKERRLLAALAVHLDQPVSEARLCDALWGDELPATATKTLQSYVSRVRKALGADGDLWIESVESGYALRCASGAVDTSEVDSLVGEARQAVGLGELDAAAGLLHGAEACWRGPVLGDLAEEPFALGEVTRLEELRLSVVEERLEVELARGRHGEVVGELEALTGRHPLRERLWAARILALYRSGRQADALRAYQDLRRTLGEELGIDPSPELRLLEEAVLLQASELDWHASAVAPTASSIAAPLPSGVVTFLLTDVEGSTRLWDTSPQAMDAALRRHDAIIAASVTAHGGTLLKARGEGDSSFSVFARASQAAAAAIAAQAALAAEPWPPGAVIRVRMAIHMGEAAEREQDYYGPAVNRVARLRGLAAGGEVLVSRSTAEVLVDQVGDEFHLVELGERTLKDLSRPEHVFALATSSGIAVVDLPSVPMPAASLAGAAPALTRGPSRPPLARALARDDLCLGRGDQLARLDVLWDKAQDGFRQAVLVAGEPGIGKTTLAAAFARRVHDQGGVVLYGRCDEDLGVPFQPFSEALRALVPGVPDDRLRALRHQAAHLARLLPELADRLPDLAPAVPAEPEAERYSLFEAVVALLAGVVADTPVVLVLDDLHWAGKPTLLLLRHLLRAEVELRLLIIATYRDTEVDRSHAFAEVLADLRRDVAVERVSLTGLDRMAVQHLVAAAAGQELDGRGLELSDALHRETGGNPFFVAEVLRHLAESGAVYQDADGRWTSDLPVDELGLPEGVRHVVGRRLSRLSPAANQALSVGAVVGPGFDLRLIEAIPDAGESRVILDALDEGVAAGLLSEDRGTYAFPHALVRQTLLEELSSTRRLRLHRSIGTALEVMAPEALEALAFHFAEAASVDPESAAKACDHALAAASRARSRSAHEEAIAHLERGLEAVELTRPIDRERRCDLSLELGELQRRLLGGSAEFRRRGVEAAEDARAIGSPDRLARAAIVAMYPEVGTPDPVGVALVEEALAAVDEDDLAARISLLSLLASHRTESEGRRDEGEALLAEMMQLARRVPPEVAAGAIVGSFRFNGSSELDFFVDILSAIPTEMLTPEQLSLMAQVRAAAAFDSGDLSALDEHLSDLRQLAEETHGWSPVYMTLAFSTTRALLGGRWADAEGTLARLADHAGDTLNALNVWAANQVLLLRDQGRHEEILPVVESATESNPRLPGFRAAQALLLAELGRLDDARRTFAPLAGEVIDSLPQDQTFSATLAMVAEVAARTGDTESSRRAFDRLLPFSGKLASVLGTIVVGAVDRYLGMLEATVGRLDDAERHYCAAIDLEERLGSRPYLARTRTWYARMLLERANVGDRNRATAMLTTALADADDLGMVVVAAEIRDLLRPPLQMSLSRVEGSIFVGREEEVDRMLTTWRAVQGGERRCVLITGEPGIGKSRLAAELAGLANGDGAAALFGRCDEGMGVPYQPFVEALRHHVATTPDAVLREQLRVRGGELVRLVPELAEMLPELPSPTRAETEAERYLLFEAVVALLMAAAAERPLVLVLDDLQWATAPTLLMLRHLLLAEAPIPVLLIGTYRDTELDASHPLSALLADLWRIPGVERRRVAGLDRQAVRAYMAAAAGHDLDDRALTLAEALHEKTQGNPFFISEVLAHLIETGAVFQGDDGRWTAAPGVTPEDLGLPAGVREVVTRRLVRLREGVTSTLRIAAVVGLEFDLAVLDSVTNGDALDEVEEAAEAGLVVEREPGRYAFAHALVRQTLLDDLSTTRRMRMHRRVGEAIEALPRSEMRLDELAWHFAEAAPDGHATKAADYALAAGRAAFARVAAEEADAIYQRGLRALEHQQPVDRARRVDLLCAIAEMHLATERFGAYHPSAAVAVDEARELGDPERFARAVMVRCQLRTIADDAQRVVLCEEALAQIGDGSPGLRAGLLADIASYYVMVGTDLDRANELAETALTLARSAHDDHTSGELVEPVLAPPSEGLWVCLETRILTLLGSAQVEERLALVDELLGIWQAGDVYRHRAVACLELGDIDGFEEAAELVGRRADDTNDDFNRMFSASFRCIRAMMLGLFDDASARLEEVLQLGDLEDPNAMALYSGAFWLITRERGELPEMMPIFEDVVVQNPTAAAFRSVLAHSLAEVGRIDEAREHFEELAVDDFARVPRDYAWTVSAAMLIETAARLGDAHRASMVAGLLRPHAGHLVITGWGVACIGAVDRYLGIAAAACGRFDEAESSFDAAIALEERIESPPLLARTRLWYARMLLNRDDDGDRGRAMDLLAEVVTVAESLGMTVLMAEAQEARS